MTSTTHFCSVACSTTCKWTPFLLSGCSWHHGTDGPVGNQGERTCGCRCQSDNGGERSSRCLWLFGRPGRCRLRAYKHTVLPSFVFWNMLVIKHTDKIIVNMSRYNAMGRASFTGLAHTLTVKDFTYETQVSWGRERRKLMVVITCC